MLSIRKTFLNIFYIIFILIAYLLPSILDYFFYIHVTGFTDYSDALIYLYYYQFIFIFSLSFLSSVDYKIFRYPFNLLKEKVFKYFSWGSNLFSLNYFFLIIFLVISSFAADLYLFIINKSPANSADITAFSAIASSLYFYKLFVYFLFAKSIKNFTRNNLFLILVTIFLLFIILFQALLGGSRWELVLFIILNYFIFYKLLFKYKIYSFLITICLLIIFIVLFNGLFFYRNSALNFIDALNFYYRNNLAFDSFNSFIMISLNIFSDRMNYVGALNRVIDFNAINPFGIYQYYQNITGLVPRLFWPEKPIIVMNLVQLGHDLGITHPNDLKTSVGLTFIGESFYLIGYLGVIIAFFQAILFTIIEKIGSYKNNLLQVFLYFLLSIEVVTSNTYTAILPRLVLLSIIFYFLYVFFFKHTKK